MTIDNLVGTKRVTVDDFLNFDAEEFVKKATDYSAFVNYRNSTRFDAKLEQLDNSIAYIKRLLRYSNINQAITEELKDAKISLLKESTALKRDNSFYYASYRTGLKNPLKDEKKPYKAHELVSLQEV